MVAAAYSVPSSSSIRPASMAFLIVALFAISLPSVSSNVTFHDGGREVLTPHPVVTELGDQFGKLGRLRRLGTVLL